MYLKSYYIFVFYFYLLYASFSLNITESFFQFTSYSKLGEYQREHEDAATDMPAYVSNPINAYLLTKRLTTDWRQVENLMSHDVGVGRLNFLNFQIFVRWLTFEHISEFLTNITKDRKSF